MKIILLSLFLCLASLASQKWQDHEHIVTFPKDWEPYYKIDKDGKPTGFAIEVFEHVAKDVGLKFRYLPADSWPEAMKMLETGKVDIIPDMGIEEKREAYTLFSLPTSTFDIDIYKRFNSYHIESIEDLQGKTVGVVSKNVGQKLVVKLPVEKTEVFQNYFEGINALVSGKVDAFIYPKPLMQTTLVNLNIEDKIISLEKPLLEIKRGIGISVKHSQLLEPLNRSLEKFLKTQKYQDIYQKYFGKEKSFQFSKEQIAVFVSMFISVVIIAMALVARNRTLLTQKDLQDQLVQKTQELNDLNLYLQSEVERKTNENIKQFQILQQQSKLAAMGEMIGAIAHQWRQPLTSLSLTVLNHQREYEKNNLSEDHMDHFTSKAMQTITFMNRTIDDFRNFFKVNMKKTQFDVNEAIREVVNIQGAQLKHHFIEIELSKESFVLEGIKSEFQQVIMNIISNAKDAFINLSHKDFKIVIDLGKDNNKNNIIRIKDNAGGIPQSILDRVFEPYFTTKSESGGTGMGLYISKMIIEDKFGGKITVKSSQVGSEFVIVFNDNKKDSNVT